MNDANIDPLNLQAPGAVVDHDGGGRVTTSPTNGLMSTIKCENGGLSKL